MGLIPAHGSFSNSGRTNEAKHNNGGKEGFDE